MRQIGGISARVWYYFDQLHMLTDISNIHFDEQKRIIIPETKFWLFWYAFISQCTVLK